VLSFLVIINLTIQKLNFDKHRLASLQTSFVTLDEALKGR